MLVTHRALKCSEVMALVDADDDPTERIAERVKTDLMAKADK